MFYAYLHAYNKPNLTGISHLIELPLFLFSLYFFIVKFGIIGAAIAWSIRTFIDMCLLGTFVYNAKNKCY